MWGERACLEGGEEGSELLEGRLADELGAVRGEAQEDLEQDVAPEVGGDGVAEVDERFGAGLADPVDVVPRQPDVRGEEPARGVLIGWMLSW